MRLRLLLAIDNGMTDLALDSHPASVGVVVLALQYPAQVQRLLEDGIIKFRPDPKIKLRGTVRLGVRWLARRLHDGIVVDARVDEDATIISPFVETIYA